MIKSILVTVFCLYFVQANEYSNFSVATERIRVNTQKTNNDFIAYINAKEKEFDEFIKKCDNLGVEITNYTETDAGKNRPCTKELKEAVSKLASDYKAAFVEGNDVKYMGEKIVDVFKAITERYNLLDQIEKGYNRCGTEKCKTTYSNALWAMVSNNVPEKKKKEVFDYIDNAYPEIQNIIKEHGVKYDEIVKQFAECKSDL